MKYQKIRIDTDDLGAGICAGLLIDCGITGYEIVDDKPVDNPFDFDYEELKPELKSMGGVVSVIFYMEEGEDCGPIIEKIQKALPDARIIKDISDESDWRDKWKDYFHSFTIGDILIKPSWEEADIAGAKTVIEIDPGISFGTGAHETTRMCIGALDAVDLEDKKVLDAGCGSGILSIAANKLGSHDITCIDIDPDCITTTKENLSKNGCNEDEFTFFTGDIMSNEAMYSKIEDLSFDVVCANILADIIITMLPRLEPKIKNGGTIITSGIIEGKQESVREALEANGFKIMSMEQDGEWIMIIGQK